MTGPTSMPEPQALQDARVTPGSAQTLRRAVVLGLPLLAVAGLAILHNGIDTTVPDNVPQAEIDRRIAQAKAFGAIALPLVTDAEIPGSVALLGLAATEQQQLLADVAARRIRLAWLSLYDSDAEDGDVVEIRSMGFSHTMTLTKTPVAVAVPVPEDGRVALYAAHDGRGGGVTVGVVTPRGPLPLPPMRVGDIMHLAVVAR